MFFHDLVQDCDGATASSTGKARCVLRRATVRFLRLKIANKLLLGFLPLVLLLIGFAVLALISLNILHTYNASIIQTDIPIINGSAKMVDGVLDQERLAKRYALLPSEEILTFFYESCDGFDDQLNMIRQLPQEKPLPLDELTSSFRLYRQFLFDSYVVPYQQGQEFGSDAQVEDELKKRQQGLLTLIANMERIAHEDQLEKTSSSAAMGKKAFRVAAIVCVIGFLLSVGAALVVTRNISSTIKKLAVATEKVAAGDFDYRPEIHNTDELGDLARSFAEMSGRLKHLERSFKASSPLTGLPGGVAIDSLLERRLASGQPLSFWMFDLDHFKAYNDRYGYSRGNEVIKLTATTISEVVREQGDEDDFVGHIGGDDFVVIANHYRYNDMCREILERFDQRVVAYYDQQDLQNGFITSKDRQGKTSRFPVAGLSVAVVSNQHRQLSSYVQVGEIAAELKKLAKSRMGSAIVVDKRQNA